MPVTIRKAEQRDLKSLGTLGTMLMAVHYAFDPQRFLQPQPGTESGYASFLGHMTEQEDTCVYVAELDGEVAGYVFAALEPLSWKELRGPAGFIHDIAVDQRHRRTGIA